MVDRTIGEWSEPNAFLLHDERGLFHLKFCFLLSGNFECHRGL